jgi:4-hydroxy-3-methylbut-2-enyl diphosphate reductase IspH
LRPTKESLDNAVNAWAQLCGAEVVSDVSDDNSGKTVILLEVSKEHGTSALFIGGNYTDIQTYLLSQFPTLPT